MEQEFLVLSNRCVISISGEDRKSFLQGLITNDVNKVSETQAVYALMLNAQGRFLYDFFVVEKGGKLLLDCSKEKVEEIVKKFSFYKLRSKIEIRKEENFLVVSGKLVGEDVVVGFVDPRNGEMGYRLICHSSFCHSRESGNPALSQDLLDSRFRGNDKRESGNDKGEGGNDRRESENDKGESRNDKGEGWDGDILKYNLHRLNLKLPDDSDLTFDKSFPLEFGFDDLNAVDYKKGCYVGQETTARTHYKGTIRKKIFLIEIPDLEKIEKGVEIESGEKKYGEVLSSVFFENKLLALALIKNLDNEGGEIKLESLKLSVLGKEIKLIK